MCDTQNMFLPRKDSDPQMTLTEPIRSYLLSDKHRPDWLEIHRANPHHIP